ncbi:hypothetical protein EUGRSUZ_C02322 [Eucalyptus grandis]|uniref:Uncharacterized protein n=2 Tax=Eucalyptus grandis TaxID=71139 RepID=A0ACC3LFV6_EUCGR|nr:hypothetical protein EUGRSUZ_C02322 [Eucalyptus grandis]
MDFDYAHSLLTGEKKWKEKSAVMSASSEAYQKLLAEALDMNRIIKPCRSIPKACQRMLDSPNISDDYNLNLLDWGANDVVAIALSETVYLWNASNGSITEQVTFNNEEGPVTSVSWAPDGQRIAIGLQNSHVQLWDFSAQRQLRTLRGGHRLRVGSLAWNNHVLTTGGMDSEVCGLKWSPSGKQLASGGNDNLLYLWNRSRAFLNSGTQSLHNIEAHTATVKALAWCPFQVNLLASGGSDRCVKFWNTCTGMCLNSVDTGSQVCALLWSKRERELLSSHGPTENQLILWKYPSRK